MRAEREASAHPNGNGTLLVLTSAARQFANIPRSRLNFHSPQGSVNEGPRPTPFTSQGNTPSWTDYIIAQKATYEALYGKFDDEDAPTPLPSPPPNGPPNGPGGGGSGNGDGGDDPNNLRDNGPSPPSGPPADDPGGDDGPSSPDGDGGVPQPPRDPPPGEKADEANILKAFLSARDPSDVKIADAP